MSCRTSAIRRCSGTYPGGWRISSGFSLKWFALHTAQCADPANALASIPRWSAMLVDRISSPAAINSMSVEELMAGRRTRSLDGSQAQRVGNAGRNILRSDGINNIDIGILKNTKIETRSCNSGPTSSTPRTRGFQDPHSCNQLSRLPEPVGHERRQPPHHRRNAVRF